MVSDVVVDLPITGECWILSPPGHSRWAFDILPLAPGTAAVADGGWWRYLTCRLHSSHVAGWARSVRSPLDGAVLISHDGEPDRDRLVPWRDVPATILRPLLRHHETTAMSGNHVIVGTLGTYVLLAHLRRGSVRVDSGQKVRAQEALGLVGASGNTLGPHLHLQVMEAPDPRGAPPVPFVVRRYQLWDGRRWQERRHSHLPARRTRIRVGEPTDP